MAWLVVWSGKPFGGVMLSARGQKALELRR
jgi:hypothetical protein